MRFTPAQVIAAWCVHLYTALGLVAAGGIAVLIVREAYYSAFLLMVVAVAIDATDGFLARRLRVREVCPNFDGRRLDDLIDFHTYTTLPLFLVWRAGLLPEGQPFWLVAPLLASAYGFCQVQAKTDDGYFLGFPSYWNIVAFYLFALKFPPWASVGVLLLCSVLTFVPSKYLYPTVGGPWSRPVIVLGAVWGAMLLWILLVPGTSPVLLWISLIYPALYMFGSWGISLQQWLQCRR